MDYLQWFDRYNFYILTFNFFKIIYHILLFVDLKSFKRYPFHNFKIFFLTNVKVSSTRMVKSLKAINIITRIKKKVTIKIFNFIRKKIRIKTINHS